MAPRMNGHGRAAAHELADVDMLAADPTDVGRANDGAVQVAIRVLDAGARRLQVGPRVGQLRRAQVEGARLSFARVLPLLPGHVVINGFGPAVRYGLPKVGLICD